MRPEAGTSFCYFDFCFLVTFIFSLSSTRHGKYVKKPEKDLFWGEGLAQDGGWVGTPFSINSFSSRDSRCVCITSSPRLCEAHGQTGGRPDCGRSQGAHVPPDSPFTGLTHMGTCPRVCGQWSLTLGVGAAPSSVVSVQSCGQPLGSH